MDFDDFDEDIFVNDDLDILDLIDFGFPRKIYERKSYFEELDNLTFFRRFRLTKNTVLYLLELVEGNLEYDNNLNNSVAPIDQLLATLRFYASAGHLSTVADFIGMDISTASTWVIASLYHQFVKMPTQDDMVKTQTEFYYIASFSRVIGCVDGTHVRIQSPGGEDPEVFRNRKSYFSINVQATCDSNLRLLDVVARWPGSANDATFFSNSRLRKRFENNEFPNCILLGDSRYMLRNYLLTPLANPVLREEQLYNEAHIRTRNSIERCFGVWKRRFPVLAYGLRFKKLNTELQVIVATAVLYNLAKQMNEQEPPLPEDINEEEINYLINIGNADVPNLNENNNMFNFRNQLINNYFARL